MLASGVRRDDRFATALNEPVPQFSSVIGAISQQLAGRRDKLEDSASAHQVVGVACGEDQSSGPAQVVGQRVDFGRSPAA